MVPHRYAIDVFTIQYRKCYGQERPPTMVDILQICDVSPRLLTLRDSPIKCFMDMKLPQALVCDYYRAIATQYFIEQIKPYIDEWNLFEGYSRKESAVDDSTASHGSEDYVPSLTQSSQSSISTDYQSTATFTRSSSSSKVHTHQEWLDFVADIYTVYEMVQRPLELDMLTIISSPNVQNAVQTSCSKALQKLLHTTPDFFQLLDAMYTQSCKEFESIYNDNERGLPIASPFSSIPNNEAILRATLDTDLPPLMDIAQMPDAFLQQRCENVIQSEDDPAAEKWVDVVTSNDLEPATAVKEFAQLCIKINALKLTPDWTKLIAELSAGRTQWNEDECISNHMLRDGLNWIRNVVLPWLSYILPSEETTWYDFLRCKLRAEHLYYKAFSDSRLSYLFEIILSYPESLPVIEDLKLIIDMQAPSLSYEVCNSYGLLWRIKDAILETFDVRLLHMGAATIEILHMAILCMHCIRIINPTCEVLLPIMDRIWAYLTETREDVPDAIVELIREEESSLDDVEEIYVFEHKELEHQAQIDDTNARLQRLQRLSLDPVALLVSMCNSTKMLIRAYQVGLANALLSLPDYNMDDEIILLEKLKSRFPQDTFSRCDVMIRDIAESTRMDRQIRSLSSFDNDGLEVGYDFHLKMLSRYYWPDGDKPSPDMDPLPGVQKFQQRYSEKFKELRGAQRLEWDISKGSVTIDLYFESTQETIQKVVNPIQAKVISLFSGTECMTSTEIASKIGVSEELVENSLDFWQTEDVLQITDDGKYQLTRI